jgi:hypothetical protein
MIEEQAPQDILFWLQEARQLMIAAERCWKADETFKNEIAEGRMQLDNKYLQMRVDAEVELNWLYNILASLSLFYIAIGILTHRDQQRFLENEIERRNIVDLVGECGVELEPRQQQFLQRVETALSLADNQGPWNIDLDPQQLKMMNQKFVQEDTVTVADKQSVDALFARLIAVALAEVSGESG